MRGGGPRHYLNLYKKVNLPNLITIKGNVAKEITGKSYEELLAEAKNGVLKHSFSTKISFNLLKQTSTEETTNVIGFIEGTDLKDEVVMLTAHYDHVGKTADKIYYGADDDGSGTVSVLTLARAFSEAKKAGKGPRRSMAFMLVSGEEKGLWGSAYYADNPIIPLEKTVCDLNIDMIGRIGDPYLKDVDSSNYVYIIGDDKLSSALRPISESANKKYTNLKLDYTYNDPNDPNRFYYRSDHYNFAEKGVPIIFYFNGVHPDYHQPTDTPDKINYPLMAKRAQLVYYTAWEIANRTESIPRDQNKL
jgi:Zn-dependent M28 family amino/carboxypeptidase